MGISNEIEHMDNVVEQLIIDKFNNFDIKDTYFSIDGETEITFSIILKEKNKDKSSNIKYKITHNNIKASIVK